MKDNKLRIGLSIFEMLFALTLMYWEGMQAAPYEPPEGTVLVAISMGFLALYTVRVQD